MVGVYKMVGVHMVGVYKVKVYEMAGGRCTNDGCDGGNVRGVQMVGVYKWWECTYGGSVRNGRGQVYK